MERNKNNNKNNSLGYQSLTLEKENKTSATKDGKGGADKVKKKANTIKKDNKGLKHKTPRIRRCCRVDINKYITPTNINMKGDLIPCKNITLITPFKPT